MRNWEVEFSEQAEIDLDNIYRYISDALHEPTTAAKQIDRIENAIQHLENSPHRAVIDEDPWKSQGLRLMNIDNYSAFFILDEPNGIIHILRISSARRDIKNIFDETDT